MGYTPGLLVLHISVTGSDAYVLSAGAGPKGAGFATVVNSHTGPVRVDPDESRARIFQ